MADSYSILSELTDSFKGSDGKFEFKLVWPKKSGNNYNIWKQSTNPITETKASVSGYEAVDINFVDNNWGGLESGYKHGGSNPSALLDGSKHGARAHTPTLYPQMLYAHTGVNNDYYFYAVGSGSSWKGGIPGASSPESQVELWVKGDLTAVLFSVSTTA